MLHGVVLYGAAAHAHGALRGLVQPGDQGHQRGLGTAGAAQGAHSLAGADVQIHIPQDPLGAGGIIFEGHMVKVDAAVMDGSGNGLAVLVLLRDRRLIGDGGHFLQYFHDSSGAGHGPGHHHEHHGHHHQRDHDLGDIGEVGQELAGLQRALVDHVAAEPHDSDDGAVDDEHHHRHVDDHHAEGLLGCSTQVIVALGELLPLVVLLYEGLHHPDAGEVLLHHQVQRVGLFLEGAEQGAGLGQNEGHHHDQKGQRHQEDVAELIADADGQKQCRHQHHRGAHQKAHAHHQRHLHVVDVVGQAGHERGRGKLLDVGKGKLLDMAVLGGAQIGAEALAGNGGAGRAAQAEAQRHHGHDHHLDALPGHIGLIGICDADVHDIAHHQGDEQLKDGLHGAARNAQDDPPAVWPQMRPKCFSHVI